MEDDATVNYKDLKHIFDTLKGAYNNIAKGLWLNLLMSRNGV